MSILSEPHFHNEAAAIARLEAIAWPNGRHCPRCGSFDRITPVKGSRLGLRHCRRCKRQSMVTASTLLKRSRIKLHFWFQAQIYGATYVMSDEDGTAKKAKRSAANSPGTVPSITAQVNTFAAMCVRVRTSANSTLSATLRNSISGTMYRLRSG
jgi:hypothetical protein